MPDNDDQPIGLVRDCLPWQSEEFNRILRQQANGKLSHALLISGQAFLGKLHFSFSVLCAMLCESTDAISNKGTAGFSVCGDCTGCRLMAAGTHPDFRLLKPVEAKSIKIEQVRDITAWVGQTAQRAGKKVVIVNPADKMTHESANALLKCLEEPAGDSLIMLVTSQPGRLLPTIRSRCQSVNFNIPARDETTDWLRQHGADSSRDNEILLDIAGGAPLAVIERFDEAFLEKRKVVVQGVLGIVSSSKTVEQVSGSVAKADIADAIDCLYDISIDCLKYLTCDDPHYVRNKDIIAAIEQLCVVYDLNAMFELCEVLKVARQELSSSSNPDPVLLLESALIALKSLSH